MGILVLDIRHYDFGFWFLHYLSLIGQIEARLALLS